MRGERVHGQITTGDDFEFGVILSSSDSLEDIYDNKILMSEEAILNQVKKITGSSGEIDWSALVVAGRDSENESFRIYLHCFELV